MDSAEMRPITGCAGPAIWIGAAGCGVDLVTFLQKVNVDLRKALFRGYKANATVAMFLVVPMHQL